MSETSSTFSEIKANLEAQLLRLSKDLSTADPEDSEHIANAIAALLPVVYARPYPQRR